MKKVKIFYLNGNKEELLAKSCGHQSWGYLIQNDIATIYISSCAIHTIIEEEVKSETIEPSAARR